MAKDKKHHYVPQCYLDHFANDGHIYYYSKKRNQHFTNAVSDVCESNFFYLITEKSWWKMMELEKDFFSSNVESSLSSIIKSIEESIIKSIPEGCSSNSIMVDESTRRSIAAQIFIQFYRTPRFRNYYKGKSLIRKGISSTTHQYTEETVTDEVLVHALSTYINKPLFNKVVNYLILNQWVFRYSKENVFLTSDNPIVWIPLKGAQQERYTIGNIGESRCFLYYPITPNIVLEIYDKDIKSLPPDFDNLVIRADADRIAGLNINTIINADDIVILQDKDISSYNIEVQLKII